MPKLLKTFAVKTVRFYGIHMIGIDMEIPPFHRAVRRFPVTFEIWVEELRQRSGPEYVAALESISPYILETFFREGCRPSLEGVLQHCQAARSLDAA